MDKMIDYRMFIIYILLYNSYIIFEEKNQLNKDIEKIGNLLDLFYENIELLKIFPPDYGEALEKEMISIINNIDNEIIKSLFVDLLQILISARFTDEEIKNNIQQEQNEEKHITEEMQKKIDIDAKFQNIIKSFNDLKGDKKNGNK